MTSVDIVDIITELQHGGEWLGLVVRMCNKSSMNVTLSVVSSLYMLFAVSSHRLILALRVYILFVL